MKLLIIKLLIGLILSLLVYHILAGIRHFIMNAGWAESLIAMRITAILVIIMSVISAVLIEVGLLW